MNIYQNKQERKNPTRARPASDPQETRARDPFYMSSHERYMPGHIWKIIIRINALLLHLRILDCHLSLYQFYIKVDQFQILNIPMPDTGLSLVIPILPTLVL